MQTLVDGLANSYRAFKIATLLLLPFLMLLVGFNLLTKPDSRGMPTELVCGDLHVTDIVYYNRLPLSRYHDVVGLVDGKAAQLRLNESACILLFGTGGVEKPAEKLPHTEELPQPPPAATPAKPQDYTA